MNPNDIIDNHYELKHQLGRGSFGEVWLATDTYLGLDVALKFYVAMDDNGRQEFRDEYSKAFRLRHNNLLTPSYYGEWNGQPYLVLEYCPASAAAQLGKLDEPTLWQFIADVAAGLAYMHSSNPTIVHQDIKPANILQKTDGHYAITDFGISVSLRSTMLRQSGREAASSVGGSIPYMGPELFGAKPVPIMASDVWALGVTIYEMATGELPFMAQGGIMQKNGAEVPELGDKWSAQLNYLLKRCLTLNTWERPMASNILKYATNILEGTNPCELKDGGNVSASPAYAPTKREVPTSQPMASQFSNLKFSTDVDCQIFIDDEPMAEAHVGRITKLPLRQGEYLLRVVSLKNESDSYQLEFEMPNADKLLKIELTPIQTERENEELRQREIEQEREKERLERERVQHEVEEKKHELEKIMEMVFVEGGTFLMSDNKNHQVTVNSFFIGKYPVTQGLWNNIMGENPSHFTLGDNYPVERVTWDDCQTFISKLNAVTGKQFRLPTEAEWEFAAKGGNQSCGYEYAGSNEIYNVAWFDGDSLSTHIIGTKQPNELGIYDVCGNVWEWCQDWYGDFERKPMINPKGAVTGMCRVLRGGSWNDNAKSCRVTFRNYSNPSYGLNIFGLRLAMSVESNE
ncbi:MAG: SUMF1/EgtB/PvdO family nonheme iron enzyme [Salinivirgaceae bacterium]|nr:SUMF1/EgtB/PvdO family nonheme iron enzyme [Salinivirgaceae bacterium]